MKILAHNIQYPTSSTFGSKTRMLLNTMTLCMGMLVIPYAQATLEHVVKAGETIDGIATRYDVSKTALIDANGVNAINLNVGQKLQVPEKGKTHNLHKVSAADTLTSLAKKYNIELNELARINRITPQSGLMINTTLVIPAAKTMNNAESAKLSPVASINHIMSGDQKVGVDSASAMMTVASTTAAEKSTSTEKVSTKSAPTTLSQASSSAKIAPIEASVVKDKMPRSATVTSKADKTHIVKYGETLSSIADLYKVTLSSLAKVNDMKVTDILYFGNTLVLPSPENKANPKKVAILEKATTAPVKYKVKSGDTLTKIASKFKTDFITVAKLSNVEPHLPLKVGQVLMVPNNSEMTETSE